MIQAPTFATDGPLREAAREIAEPGRYFLGQDLNDALSISCSDVTLDFMGCSIIGSSSPDVATNGVSLASGISNIVIRGGCVTGHQYGVLASDVRNLTVDRMSFRAQRFRGVGVAGSDISIRNSCFEQIGGSSRYSDAYAMAMEINGPRANIQSNIVRDIYPTDSGEGVGIALGYDCNESLIEGNLIANTHLPKTGRTFGIWSSAERTIIRDNFISLMAYGVEGRGASQNIVIDVPCGSYLRFANNDHRANTGRPIFCPDDYGAVSRAFDVGDRNDLFRMAQIHRGADAFLLAYVYFLLAGEAGSTEAVDEARNLVAGKLVTTDEAQNAEQLKVLLRDHHARNEENRKLQG